MRLVNSNFATKKIEVNFEPPRKYERTHHHLAQRTSFLIRGDATTPFGRPVSPKPTTSSISSTPSVISVRSTPSVISVSSTPSVSTQLSPVSHSPTISLRANPKLNANAAIGNPPTRNANTSQSQKTIVAQQVQRQTQSTKLSQLSQLESDQSNSLNQFNPLWSTQSNSLSQFNQF